MFYTKSSIAINCFPIYLILQNCSLFSNFAISLKKIILKKWISGYDSAVHYVPYESLLYM